MGLPNPSVFSLYWDQFCDEDDDSILADPFAADPGDLPIDNSGCGGDGAIDSIAEYMMGGTFGGVTYPSKMAEDWDVVSIFAGYTNNFASGCGSKPGELLSTCLKHVFILSTAVLTICFVCFDFVDDFIRPLFQ